jgi:hypothetical protein
MAIIAAVDVIMLSLYVQKEAKIFLIIIRSLQGPVLMIFLMCIILMVIGYVITGLIENAL